MEKGKLTFTKKATQLFLKGGQVVDSKHYICHTYLIRMPKDEFVEFNGQIFEFIWIQNFTDKKDILYVGGYYKGSLRDAKKHMAKEHSEQCQSIITLKKAKEKTV